MAYTFEPTGLRVRLWYGKYRSGNIVYDYETDVTVPIYRSPDYAFVNKGAQVQVPESFGDYANLKTLEATPADRIVAPFISSEYFITKVSETDASVTLGADNYLALETDFRNGNGTLYLPTCSVENGIQQSISVPGTDTLIPSVILCIDKNGCYGWLGFNLNAIDGAYYVAHASSLWTGTPLTIVDPNAPAEPTYDRTAFLSGMAMGLCGKGNPTFEGSGKMLYNGVELPDINSVLSQYPQYPYVLVLHSETTVYFHLLCISTNQCDTVNGFGGKWVTSNGVGIAFLLENGEWIRKYDFENRAWTPTTKVIWTSHDILNDDNSDDSGIYLAASPNPVPVEDAFSKGYHVGAELRRKRVLPVAYLYNGVKFPKIPTVDGCPYVVITYSQLNSDGSVSDGRVRFSSIPLGATYAKGEIFGQTSNHQTGKLIIYKLAEINDNGDFIDPYWELYSTYDDYETASGVEPRWTNTDMERFDRSYDASGNAIYDENGDMVYTATGTVGFAASDPVPVYE